MNNSRSRRWYAVSLGILGIALVVVGVDVAPGSSTTVASDTTFDAFEPTWSPDGTTIAFVNGTGATGTSIQAVPAAGGARTTLVTALAPPPDPRAQRLNSPAYSPGGGKLAYVQFSINDNVNQSQLWVKDLAPGGAT